MNNKSPDQIKLAADPIPIYYKLQRQLKESIENGRWTPGELIPSSRVLAQTYGISMGTVQKAISHLVNEKYLYSVQGKGTFVATTNIKQESLRYVRLRKEFDGEDQTFEIRVIDFGVTDGFQPACSYLKARINDALYRIKRVFITHSEPIVYNISYLPRKMFQGLEELVGQFERATLYESIEKKYGLPTVLNKELFGIGLADQETAEALGIEAGLPVLSIEMVSYTYKDQPYEYRISYALTNMRKLYREIR
jgi:GntR family transcriptional regulator